MCGRAAQSLQTVQYAAQRLLQEDETSSRISSYYSHHHKNTTTDTTSNTTSNNDILTTTTTTNDSRTCSMKDNFNIAPGHETFVFYASTKPRPTSNNNSNVHHNHSSTNITYSPLTWGLCPSDGTRKNPLPEGPSKHFSNLMFNARADTLYSKKTFSQLALAGQTCIWAVDGYFEWKDDEQDVLKKGGKQPYFVKSGGGSSSSSSSSSTDGMPLWIPGLWTRVKTGKLIQIHDGETTEDYIETFTIITTDACPALKWLHSRQPILIFDLDLARQWLYSPSLALLEQMVKHSSLMGGGKDWIQWHPVTKQMSKIGHVGEDCVKPIKIEKVSSVKSFFSTEPSRMMHSATTATTGRTQKHPLEEGQKKRVDEGKNDWPIKKSKTEKDGMEGIKKFLHDSKEISYTSTSSSNDGQSPCKGKNSTSENRKNNVKKKGPIDAFFFKKTI